jgi:hypothetical protein
MALTELVNALRQQAIKQREREGELLNDIAYLADLETAEAAADIYAAEKHAYSFDGYLYQLEKLKTVLAAGVPPETIVEEQEFTESKRAAGNEPAGDDFMQMPEGEELPFN